MSGRLTATHLGVCRPASAISSQTAFEPTQMWWITRSASPPCEMEPAGTKTLAGSFSPGTREPQTLQNHVCHRVSGFVHVATCSVPRTHRNVFVGTTTTAMPPLPGDLRQIEQWQT